MRVLEHEVPGRPPSAVPLARDREHLVHGGDATPTQNDGSALALRRRLRCLRTSRRGRAGRHGQRPRTCEDEVCEGPRAETLEVPGNDPLQCRLVDNGTPATSTSGRHAGGLGLARRPNRYRRSPLARSIWSGTHQLRPHRTFAAPRIGMPRCRSTSATSTPAGVNASAVGVVDVSGAVATGCHRGNVRLSRVSSRG